MKYFPTICVDSFYENVDDIRKLALAQEYYKSENGRWPGKRTKELHEIDRDLFDHFCMKLFSCFFDFTNSGRVEWTVETSFQLIESLDANPESVKNKGWIHQDIGSAVLAGVIYLSPNANLDSGTSVFKLKSDENSLDKSDVKIKYFKDGIDDNYDELLLRHNSSFEETIRFNNVYNRLVLWNGDEWHGVNSFYNEEPRLTQVFFVNRLEMADSAPLTRYNGNWKINAS